MSAITERAEQALRDGDCAAALRHLQDGVRAEPANAKLRVFLFQLLCVQGNWPRALTQLQVCGELDAATLPMVNTYREAIHCEALRAAVWAGQTTPLVFGQPEAWVAWLVEALQADARGDGATAARLRDAAIDAAAATPGTLDGAPFDWIADADSRLGPLLEAVINGRYSWVPFAALNRVAIEPPGDLRDLVWAPAQLEFSNGGTAVALLPARYASTVEEGDDRLRLARRTDWRELAERAAGEPSGHFRGLGQRVLATSGAEFGLLDIREIVLQPAAPGERDEPDSPPPGTEPA